MEGDVIFVHRKRLGLKPFTNRKSAHSTRIDELICRTCTYKHYGIEVEDGNVIHFICDSIFLTKYGMIKKVTMDEFLKDGEKEVDTTINYKYSRKHIVKRAYSKIDTTFDGYHPFKNNCEHFTAWCANGFKTSSQSDFTRKAYTLIKLPKRATKRIVVSAVTLFSILKL